MKPPADVQQWHATKEELAALKEKELTQRLALVAKYFTGERKGTVNVDLGKGYGLKGKFEIRSKLDPDKTRAALAKFPTMDPAGAELAKRVVRWDPVPIVGEIKKLPLKLATLIRKALTETPSTPSLELIEPKGATK